MKLRALEQQDYQNWLLLWQGYQAFYKVEIDHKVTEKRFLGYLIQMKICIVWWWGIKIL